MADTYLKHLTSDGDRWDLLAARYYGDAMAFSRIVGANPNVPITTTLAAGLVLLIPVVDEDEAPVADDLPPWKR